MTGRQILKSILAFGLLGALVVAGCQPGASPAPTAPAAVETSAFVSPFTSPFASPLAFNSPIEAPPPYPTPTLPKPAGDKAAVRGAIFSRATGMPISETSVYLTQGIGERRDEPPPVLIGPLANDIRGRTDLQGWFVFNDVPPGVYYMVIWAPLNWVVLETVRGSVASPVQLKVEPGRVLDLGQMLIYWP